MLTKLKQKNCLSFQGNARYFYDDSVIVQYKGREMDEKKLAQDHRIN